MQLAFTTVDELFALLEQAGEALDYREVWPRLFPVANCPPELARTMVDDIVRSDERFAWESDVHIGLAAWKDQRRDLADVVFTVVDLETTGATPGFSKITEIGAVRVVGGEQVATFSQLVNPGVHISSMITSITGIDDATVADAPPIEDVLPRFVEFSAGTVLAAHNARFDLGFLDYELGKLLRCTFPRPALDTLRLARKLCPQQRCSLSALAYRFDTRVKPEHRALQDAQATAELLVLFLSWLQEQGMSTLEEVARFCEPGARRNYHKIALTDALPTAPGVYIMRDAHGHALYIGKAENLRRRTRDHFLQRQAYHARQALELLERIEVVETGSEFGALLLEQRLIARHKPHYNSHGTRARSYQYVKLSAEQYPRLYATPNLRDDGAYYAGPFRKASTARRFIECLTGVYPLRTCARLPKAARAGDGAPKRRPRAGPRPAAPAARASTPARAPTRAPASRRAGDRSTGSTTTRSRRCAACSRATASTSTAACRSARRSWSSAWRSSRRAACSDSARPSSAPCAASAACAPRRRPTPCSPTRRPRPDACACGACPTAPWSPTRRSRRARSRSTAACSSWRRSRRRSRPHRRSPPPPSTRSSSSTAGCSATPRPCTCSTCAPSSRATTATATPPTPHSRRSPRNSSRACVCAARRRPRATTRTTRNAAASGRRSVSATQLPGATGDLAERLARQPSGGAA